MWARESSSDSAVSRHVTSWPGNQRRSSGPRLAGGWWLVLAVLARFCCGLHPTLPRAGPSARNTADRQSPGRLPGSHRVTVSCLIVLWAPAWLWRSKLAVRRWPVLVNNVHVQQCHSELIIRECIWWFNLHAQTDCLEDSQILKN